MARIARLIIYECEEEDLAKQLAGSMAEGIHEKGKVTITIIKLSSEPILDGFINKAKGEVERNSSMSKAFQSNYGGKADKEKSESNLDLELRKIDLQSMVDR